MNRKQFLKKAALGVGAAAVLPSLASITACQNEPKPQPLDEGPCGRSPQETEGPFPNKASKDYAQASIAGDRKGLALTIGITILSKDKQCQPLPGVFVDIWHCDAHGEYSEYGGGGMQPADHTHEHFLRGRLATDQDGRAIFLSIFPGWYRGRAPHLHVEVLDKDEQSLLVTQIAFPEEVCAEVYATEHYKGKADMTNEQDNVFSDSLHKNMADVVRGNTAMGYGLMKNIIV